jgi:hypothetical protein
MTLPIPVILQKSKPKTMERRKKRKKFRQKKRRNSRRSQKKPNWLLRKLTRTLPFLVKSLREKPLGHSFLERKFKENSGPVVKVSGKKLSLSQTSSPPYRLRIERNKVTVKQRPSSFKSAWRKNVGMLGGRIKGRITNRVIWKIASKITRFGMTKKLFYRLQHAYTLLIHGRSLGFSRIVSELGQ